MEAQPDLKTETRTRTVGTRYLRILHFNDVYELDDHLPKFIEGLNCYRQTLDPNYQKPLTVFSGDIFSPT